MKFIIGDKVRFLDSKEKGIVSKIISEKMVMVEIESDFEIPIAVNELVFDGVRKEIEEPENRDFEKVLNQPLIVSSSQKNKIYICFESIDETNNTESDLNLVLVNTTSYNALFSYFHHEQKVTKWIANAEVQLNSKIKLTQIKRNKINEWKEIVFQFIFFKKENFELRNPVNSIVRLKQEKFFAEQYYISNSFTTNKAIEIEVFNFNTAVTTLSEDMLRKQLAESIIEKKDTLHKPLPKQILQEQEREIDLHIEELLDNYSGMSNFEIVQFQLNYFQKKLDEAIVSRMKKLIIIHGVGNGKLKNEVHKILLTYQGIRYFDASYQKYGYGATEVVIY